MMMDKMAIKKKILEQLLEHMDDSQGGELHELVMSKHKPDAMEKLEIEADPAGKPEEAEEMEEKDEADPLMAKAKHAAKEGDEEELSDDEIEELLKGLG